MRRAPQLPRVEEKEEEEEEKKKAVAVAVHGRFLRSTGIGPAMDTCTYVSLCYFYGPLYLTVTCSVLVWPEEYVRGIFWVTTS